MTLGVHQLAKRYGQAFALHIPKLRLQRGETLGLVGNNGAGKTTFLRLVLDLLPADEGFITIGDARVDQTTAWKKRTGSYLDRSFLIDFLTPDEFLCFAGSTYDLSEKEVYARLEPFRDFFAGDVLGPSQRYIRDLSTGNAKKVGIAAALLVRPDLLILDEPFANLDPRSQLQLIDLLRRTVEEVGTTMIVSSHDLRHVTKVCRRIAVLDGGQIVRDERTTEGTLHDLEAYFAREIRAA